jgi:hypothetical protein
MEYIISENRLIKLIDKYIEERIGKLKKIPSNDVNARDGDFELVADDGTLIFGYLDYHLSVKPDLFYSLMGLFNLNKNELENLIEKWFSSHFPDSFLIQAYCSLY